MKLSRFLVCCLTFFVVSCGCSKAELPIESESNFALNKATPANPAIKRPRWCFPKNDLDVANLQDVVSELQQLMVEKAVLENASFVGFETFLTNGYSYTFATYTTTNSPNYPAKFAGLLGLVESDSTGSLYTTCPVSPGPSGIFAIPNTINSMPVVFVSEGAFSDCSAIEHLLLPNSLIHIGCEAFKDCTSLCDLVLPNNLRLIDVLAFSGCTSLKSVCIPSPSKNILIESKAFANCNSIVNLMLPDTDILIHGSAFRNAFNTTTLPEGPIVFGNWCLGTTSQMLTSICVSNGLHIAPGFYQDIKAFKTPFSLHIDSGDTDKAGNLYIPDKAFFGSTNLQSVSIGPHINEIGLAAFDKCPNITNIVFEGTIDKFFPACFRSSTNAFVRNFQYGSNPEFAVSSFSPQTLLNVRNRLSSQLDVSRLDAYIILRAIRDFANRDSNDWIQALEPAMKRFGVAKKEDIDILHKVFMTLMWELKFPQEERPSNSDIALFCEVCNQLDAIGGVWGMNGRPTYLVSGKPKPEQKIEHGRMFDLLLNRLWNNLSEYYNHPCGHLVCAKVCQEDGDKIKAVQLYQSAAVGFAQGLCPRISNPLNPYWRSSSNVSDSISKCIQAIDDLGFHSLAEETLIQIQNIGMRIPNDPNSSIHFGTAWLINDSTIATCHHVIKDCREIWTETENGTRIDFAVLAQDVNNDIAILKAKTPIPNHTSLPVSSKLGTIASRVFTVGFPLPDIMGSEKKYNDGTISALSGIGNDNRFYQISIPIQPGNSGGAVVSEEGLVIGLAAAALDAEKVFKLTGSIPQNVNYAIKSRYITALLQDNGIPYDETPPKSGTDTKTIVDQVSRATILLKAK